MSIQLLNQQEIIHHLEDIARVYQSVYTLPPYNETQEHVLSFKKALPVFMEKKGFVCFAAIDTAKKLQGFCFGWESVSGGKFNTRVQNLLGDKAKNWLENCFEIVDIAVDPQHQGQGLGKSLLQNILENITHKQVLLQTHREDTVASKMYIKQGWKTVVDQFEISDGKCFRIFGKKLN